MGEQQQQGQHWDLQCNGNEHQAQMRRCGIGEGAFDINLGQCHQRPADCTDAADHQHHSDRDGGELKDRHHLEKHDRSAGHHNRVPEDRSRIGPLHRFIKPEVHRELGALAGGSRNQAQAEQRGRQR